MEQLISKTKSFYSGLISKKSSYDRPAIRPSADWQMLLSTFSVIFILLAIVSTYFYIEISAGNLFNLVDDSFEKEIKLDTSLLEKTIGEMNKRATDLSNTKSGIGIPSDPSL